MAAVLRDVSDWQCIDYLLKQNLQELINHQRWDLNYYLQAVFDLTGASAIDKILKEHAVCKFFNKKSVQIVKADSHISD